MLTPSLAAVPARGYPYMHRDTAWRLARGVPKAVVASVGKMGWDELDRLIARPEFDRLVRAYEAKELRARGDWRDRLIRIAYEILEQAALAGDLRAARFIIYESNRGRDPGETVVAAVERAARRNARQMAEAEPVPEQPESAPPIPSEPPPAGPPAPEATPGMVAARPETVPMSARARLTAMASRDRCLFRDRVVAEELAGAALPEHPGPFPACRRPQPAPAPVAESPAPPPAATAAAQANHPRPPADPTRHHSSRKSGQPAPTASPATHSTPSRPPPRTGPFGRDAFSTSESSTPKTLPKPEPPPGRRPRDGP